MPVQVRLRAPLDPDSTHPMERITSRQNAHFKLARKLIDSSRERVKAERILLDGTRLVGSYLERIGTKDVQVLVSEAGALRESVQQLIATIEARNVFQLEDALFAEIAQVETPEGITAIVPTPRVASPAKDDFRVLLDGVQDPGNLGGLLRTAAAAGATSAHLAKGCADVWSPKSLRGGMGAQFILPVRERVDMSTALAGFRGIVLATSPRADQSIYDVDLTGPVAMIFGSEGRGLDQDVQSLATTLVNIPMIAGVESLNVAAAAAVCCFERLRQTSGSRSKKS